MINYSLTCNIDSIKILIRCAAYVQETDSPLIAEGVQPSERLCDDDKFVANKSGNVFHYNVGRCKSGHHV